tara:strand:- start:4348 stop:5379 length:1032 start_codon:yes stop_codon:yes gene_type:complete
MNSIPWSSFRYPILLISLTAAVWACHPEAPQETGSQAPANGYPWLPDDLGPVPQILRPGELSTAIDKFNFTLSPGGDTVFYCATNQKLGFTAPAYQVWNGTAFDPPQWLPFAEAEIPMADVQMSSDGKQLFYSTFKDYPGKAAGFHFDLWQVRWKNNAWQEPQPLKGELASAGNEFYPVLTNSGRLYFNSDFENSSDLYYADFKDGVHGKAIALPANINTEAREADAFVAADESYIIFVRVDAEDGFGNSDLYISFRRSDTSWTDPQNLGPTINSDQIDGSPWLSPDGQYLVFTTGRKEAQIKQEAITDYEAFKGINESSRNGSLNFYACKIDLEYYRKKAQK